MYLRIQRLLYWEVYGNKRRGWIGKKREIRKSAESEMTNGRVDSKKKTTIRSTVGREG